MHSITFPNVSRVLQRRSPYHHPSRSLHVVSIMPQWNIHTFTRIQHVHACFIEHYKRAGPPATHKIARDTGTECLCSCRILIAHNLCRPYIRRRRCESRSDEKCARAFVRTTIE